MSLWGRSEPPTSIRGAGDRDNSPWLSAAARDFQKTGRDRKTGNFRAYFSHGLIKVKARGSSLLSRSRLEVSVKSPAFLHKSKIFGHDRDR